MKQLKVGDKLKHSNYLIPLMIVRVLPPKGKREWVMYEAMDNRNRVGYFEVDGDVITKWED